MTMIPPEDETLEDVERDIWLMEHERDKDDADLMGED